MTDFICISELGDGWNPTILNTEEEFQFVDVGAFTLNDDTEERVRYSVLDIAWIGGSSVGRGYGNYIPELGSPESWLNRSISKLFKI